MTKRFNSAFIILLVLLTNGLSIAQRPMLPTLLFLGSAGQVPQYGVISQANDEGRDFIFLKRN